MRNCPKQLTFARDAFTLVELMISIAIVLVLMLGINFVFTTSSQTISTGMALTQVGRDMRGARKVFEQDFRNITPVADTPTMVIHSEGIFAFQDNRDRLADYDTNPAT